MLPLVVKGEALCRALALVIAAALADAVHVAPVALRLWVFQRVAIYLKSVDYSAYVFAPSHCRQVHRKVRLCMHQIL